MDKDQPGLVWIGDIGTPQVQVQRNAVFFVDMGGESGGRMLRSFAERPKQTPNEGKEQNRKGFLQAFTLRGW